MELEGHARSSQLRLQCEALSQWSAGYNFLNSLKRVASFLVSLNLNKFWWQHWVSPPLWASASASSCKRQSLQQLSSQAIGHNCFDVEIVQILWFLLPHSGLSEIYTTQNIFPVIMMNV